MHGPTAADAEIVVVGSVNLDTVLSVDHLPRPGETVLADQHATHLGGKGANQAIAAARLGRRVALVGAVGDDPPGKDLRYRLQAEGVDVSGLRTAPGLPTGAAFIAVDGNGENSIVVAPGANGAVTPQDAAQAVAGAPVVLLQLEIPAEAVAAAVAAATGSVILNPAPARRLDTHVLGAVAVLVPNETELAYLTGSVAASRDEIADLASTIDGPAAVVVTMGAEGALVVANGEVTHLPAPAVDVVDTTAAGDAFCGALADAVVTGSHLVDAVRWAVAAGAAATTVAGAAPSLPSRDAVERLL